MGILWSKSDVSTPRADPTIVDHYNDELSANQLDMTIEDCAPREISPRPGGDETEGPTRDEAEPPPFHTIEL